MVETVVAVEIVPDHDRADRAGPLIENSAAVVGDNIVRDDDVRALQKVGVDAAAEVQAEVLRGVPKNRIVRHQKGSAAFLPARQGHPASGSAAVQGATAVERHEIVNDFSGAIDGVDAGSFVRGKVLINLVAGHLQPSAAQPTQTATVPERNAFPRVAENVVPDDLRVAERREDTGPVRGGVSRDDAALDPGQRSIEMNACAPDCW